MLEPLFEALYPEHPYFVESLTSDVVEKFVLGLSESEGRPDQSAMTFGVALDVAEFGDSGFAVLPKEKLGEAAYARAVLEVIGERGEADLEAIHARLSRSPVGLTLEAVRLILSAMAHRGLIELITKEKERVTGRSIDLKLDWSNIVSATSPKNIKLSDADLLEWARLVCSDTSISSLSDAADRSQILEAFVEISSQWERRNPFAAFESVPDCDLDTRIWRHSNRTWEAYTAMVGDVNETLIGDITIEESLDRICGNFLARPEIFQRSRNSITAIEDFARARPEIDRIGNYLALAEITDDKEVEAARAGLREALQQAMHSPSEQSLREVGYCWDKFLRLYSEFYADMHKMLANPTDFRRFLEETLGTSPAEALAQLQDYRQRPKFRSIKRRLAAYHCPLDPEPFLKSNPFCKCGFQISAHSFLEELRDELRSLLSNVPA
jgi:hypothetical protein